MGPTEIARAGEFVISYISFSVGPMARGPDTAKNRLKGIRHLDKIKLRCNHLGNMSRVRLTTKGMVREKGPAARKLPFTVDDLMALGIILNMNSMGHRIVWRTSLRGWFFMRRITDILFPHNKNM